MDRYNFALATLIFAVVWTSSTASGIESHAVYSIFNKADNGSLTVNSNDTESPAVYIKKYTESAGQKWRAKRPILFKSFELKPTSNEQADLDADSATLNIFARISASGDTKYWYIRDMAEGVYQIKSYQFGTCLSSQGFNKVVVLASCDNSNSQQWTFNQL